MDHVETSIRERAYALWERDGRAPGRDEHYWLLAERELRTVVEAPAAAEAIVAEPVRRPAARKPAASKSAAAKSPAAKTVAAMAEAVAKPAPRRRRAAAETVTTH
ncbi:hypothetical protein SQ03_27185 [Methylobacterium platani JCM 14648]|uniref:DUF2934 domain-containing protein n=3 Tax=Methylobacterium platani TaxID=427683 RepID=A0A179S5Q5_9HYPH|nr:hypothetical protein SQ03_27185 [Methylobacterium platani JCM 14648]OAS22028.1 hypothetical protein A5481_20335 [Methylobacterium platani]